MMILLTDVYHTRRARLCHILDHSGDLAWSGKFVHEALEWFLEHDHPEFQLQGPNGQRPFEVLLHRI